MEILPESIKKLINILSYFPSIGPRQATRLAFYLINKGQNEIIGLIKNLEALNKIKICNFCFFPHENQNELCDICQNTERNKSIIMIIEKETDLLSLEKANQFNGRYLIIGEISKKGILEEWQKLRLQNLKSFIQRELNGKAEEIILAFNPDSIGNFTSSIIEKEIRDFSKKITRLARGLPTGGEIEFADDETLKSAIQNRV
ncbi:MAG: toprim domain-containing protein [Patescibacteria group bacterium]|nr:toprim domain-containing protein [Patescibacteria group bacterium]MDW8279956.1 toprim domain-containing protein [bacterium]